MIAAIDEIAPACAGLLAKAELPLYARAIFAALRFGDPQMEALARLSDADWDRALAFADRTRLTLPLGLRCGRALPSRVASRIAADLENNAERWGRQRAAYEEIAGALDRAGIEFAVLKGFSHCPHFIRDPRHRTQGDIDLWVLPEQLPRARDVAAWLGYKPMEGFERFPLDHLPRMIRKTGWRWRGDFFDVEMPLSLELHFRLWDARTERLAPEGLDAFWQRREIRSVDSLAFPALCAVDTVGYATLHVLRHVLRGDLQVAHVYELASLLDGKAVDAAFWERWMALHPGSLRRLEAVAFSLAHAWFDCQLPAAARDQIAQLPAEARRWLRTSAAAPLEAMFGPNKDEIWLHWSLLDSPRDRWSVLRRRILPANFARYHADPHATKPSGWRTKSLKFAAARAVRHARALANTARRAVRWFAPDFPDAEYFRLFRAAAVFNLGRYIFVLLYNLYLLQAGLRENVLGGVASAMTAGSLAGTFLAAAIMRRVGTRNFLLCSFPAIAAVSILQTCATQVAVLVALAFAAGLVSASWAVAISPAIAERTTERNRALGFSLMFSSGVGIGIAGGFFGGHLPRWLAHGNPLASYRPALLVSCAIVMLAMWPLAHMKACVPIAGPRSALQRPSPLLVRYLAAIAIWNFGTGAFNPFFNAYFAHLGLAVSQIGNWFSAVHLIQASAMLMAPAALRRFGMRRGVSAMQAATAMALLGLAAARGPMWAGIAYVAYMTAQYASEPGMYAFLMNAAPEAGRPAASAQNFAVIFASQAAGQALSGTMLARAGYPPVLACAAVICMAGALLFRSLPEIAAPDPPPA